MVIRAIFPTTFLATLFLTDPLLAPSLFSDDIPLPDWPSSDGPSSTDPLRRTSPIDLLPWTFSDGPSPAALLQRTFSDIPSIVNLLSQTFSSRPSVANLFPTNFFGSLIFPAVYLQALFRSHQLVVQLIPVTHLMVVCTPVTSTRRVVNFNDFSNDPRFAHRIKHMSNKLDALGLSTYVTHLTYMLQLEGEC